MQRRNRLCVLRTLYGRILGLYQVPIDGSKEEAEVYNTAIDMAIEALSEPKIIIGIDIPYGSDKGIATIFKSKDEKLTLEEVKEIMSVVRCKDCRWCQDDYMGTWCGRVSGVRFTNADGFCSHGERREP